MLHVRTRNTPLRLSVCHETMVQHFMYKTLYMSTNSSKNKKSVDVVEQCAETWAAETESKYNSRHGILVPLDSVVMRMLPS